MKIFTVPTKSENKDPESAEQISNSCLNNPVPGIADALKRLNKERRNSTTHKPKRTRCKVQSVVDRLLQNGKDN